MELINGYTYRIISHAGTGRYLNVYGNETVADTRNVCLYDNEFNAKAQRWVLNNNKIFTAISTYYALNIHSVSNPNCTMYTSHGDINNTDSKLTIIPYDAENGLFRIKLANYDLYLFAESMDNLANVSWQPLTSNTSTSFIWKFRHIPVAPHYTAAPSFSDPLQRYSEPIISTGTLTISDIPDYQFGSGYDTCTFHAGCGFSGDTNFNNSSEGYDIIRNIKKFVSKVYGANVSIPTNKLTYYLFGEKFSETASADIHPGIDILGPDGHDIKSLFSGTVTYAGGNYGTVSVYNHELGVTFNYIHMKNICVSVNSYISAGTKIGQQSNVSTQNIGSHLHFEVRPGNTPGPTSPIKSTNVQMTTIVPYGFMNGEV